MEFGGVFFDCNEMDRGAAGYALVCNAVGVGGGGVDVWGDGPDPDWDDPPPLADPNRPSSFGPRNSGGPASSRPESFSQCFSRNMSAGAAVIGGALASGFAVGGRFLMTGLRQVRAGASQVATGSVALNVWGGISVATGAGASGYIASGAATFVSQVVTHATAMVTAGEAALASGASLMTIGTAIIGGSAAFVTGYGVGTAIGCGLGII